ncbi:MAG: hypothetical protein EHM34_06125 [Nitrosopumilales archaeon]|nr:MAG: hypothetical protein EHM34_06125 [Nitrosopumilales archaeon]
MFLKFNETLEVSKQTIQKLSPRDRRVIEMRIGVRGEKPMTEKEIAKEYDVDVRRIKTIMNRVWKTFNETKKEYERTRTSRK